MGRDGLSHIRAPPPHQGARGTLRPGARGCGFGVTGREALPECTHQPQLPGSADGGCRGVGKGFCCLNRSRSAHAAALAIRAAQSPGPAPSSPSPARRVGASSVLPSAGQPGAFWSSTKARLGGGEKQSPPDAASPAEHGLCARTETPRTCPRSALASLPRAPSETSARRCQTDISRCPGPVGRLVRSFSLEAARRDIHPEPGRGFSGAALLGGPGAAALGTGSARPRFALPAAGAGHAMRLPSHLGAAPRSGTGSRRRKRFGKGLKNEANKAASRRPGGCCALAAGTARCPRTPSSGGGFLHRPPPHTHTLKPPQPPPPAPLTSPAGEMGQGSAAALCSAFSAGLLHRKRGGGGRTGWDLPSPQPPPAPARAPPSPTPPAADSPWGGRGVPGSAAGRAGGSGVKPGPGCGGAPGTLAHRAGLGCGAEGGKGRGEGGGAAGRGRGCGAAARGALPVRAWRRRAAPRKLWGWPEEGEGALIPPPHTHPVSSPKIKQAGPPALGVRGGAQTRWAPGAGGAPRGSKPAAARCLCRRPGLPQPPHAHRRVRGAPGRPRRAPGARWLRPGRPRLASSPRHAALGGRPPGARPPEAPRPSSCAGRFCQASSPRDEQRC